MQIQLSFQPGDKPNASNPLITPDSALPTRIPFGRPMRHLFNFAPGHTPLNHGSYGTFPRYVLEYKIQRQRDYEARPSIYHTFVYPSLLKQSRALVAPFLGADTDEVVFVPNATTGINTVLRNVVPTYEEGDVIVYPSTIYSSCLKTIQSLEETTAVRGVEIEVVYPVEDDELVRLLRENMENRKV